MRRRILFPMIQLKRNMELDNIASFINQKYVFIIMLFVINKDIAEIGDIKLMIKHHITRVI